MNQNLKSNYFTIPISFGIVALVALILYLCGVGCKFYLIGAALGCFVHAMMVKQTTRIAKFAKIDPECKVFNPKKSSILWFLVRTIVTIAVLAAVVYISGYKDNSKEGIINIALTLAGFTTIKIVFIACLVIFREKVHKE